MPLPGVTILPQPDASGRTVTLTYRVTPDWDRVVVQAAAPLQRGYSYAGSGMPYPNPSHAFDGEPNRVVLRGGESGQVPLAYPGSFYDWRMRLVPPTLFLQGVRAVGGPVATAEVALPRLAPLRTLVDRPERWTKGAAFYQERLDRTGVRDGWDANVGVVRDLKLDGTG